MGRSHDIKCYKPFFTSVYNGDKTAELRKNDRDYQVGDTLILHETTNCYYTGRMVAVRVTHIVDNFIALRDNYCMLSFRVIKHYPFGARRRIK